MFQGQVLFKESDPCHRVFFRLEGEVEMSKKSADGDDVIVEHAHYSSVLGLSECVMGAHQHLVRASQNSRTN